METYKIEIKEILSRTIELKASSLKDAIEKVEDLYRSEDIILDYNDFKSLDINPLEDVDKFKKTLEEVVEYLYENEKLHFESFDNEKPKDHIFLKLLELKKHI